MKKKWIALVCLVTLLFGAATVSADELMDITRKAYPDVKDINRPRSSLIIDGNTGDVLWQDNIDEVRDPASMSKLMTLYLLFEAMEQGKLSEDTIIKASQTDQNIAGIYEISNNKIVAGVDYTISELITMTVVPSSNATTVMIANYLSNNYPAAFLDQMNSKAKELGMTNTHWYNASGAAASSFKGFYTPQRYDNNAANQTTARDLAILAYNFVKKYPGILKYTNKPVVTVKKGTPYEETFETYNYSVPGAKYGLEGVDGLKTGSSPRGAFNYIATVKRGEQRIISVIMGVGDWSDQDGEYYRHPFGNALIEKAYADYEYKKLLTAGEHKIDGKTYKLEKDFYGTVKKGTNPKLVVKDGVLEVDNGLLTLSTLISDGMKVELADDGDSPVMDSKNDQGANSSNKAKSGLLLDPKLLLLVPVLVLFAIVFLESGRRKKRNRPLAGRDNLEDDSQNYSRRNGR